MAKRKRTRTAKQIENRKKVFHFLESMAVGAVKFWIAGRKIILPIDQATLFQRMVSALPIDQVDDFVKSQIDEME